jgi:hypothetical protein
MIHAIEHHELGMLEKLMGTNKIRDVLSLKDANLRVELTVLYASAQRANQMFILQRVCKDHRLSILVPGFCVSSGIRYIQDLRCCEE